MGKYGKYFCMSVSHVLITIGTFMVLLNLIAIGLNISCFYALIDKLQILDVETQPDFLVGYVAISTFTFYIMSAFFHSFLCCKACYQNTKKFFIFYLILVSINTICALIDGIVKLETFLLVAMFFFLFFTLNILCIIAAIMARHELLLQQQQTLNLFNTGHGNEAFTSGHKDLPKFSMTVNVEKVESQNGPEAEPLNKI
ncbi:hypothetical protein ACKWTF_016485 [Chironomus riparius]